METYSVLGEFTDKKNLSKSLGVTPRTIDRWCAMPDGLPFISIQKKRFFRIEGVREWLRARERRPNPRRAA